MYDMAPFRRVCSGKPRYAAIRCLLALLVLGAAGFAGVGCQPDLRQRIPVIVASGTSTEQVLLGHITALMLEENGYDVERKIGFGSDAMVRRALVAGNVDVTWEYTGDAWTTYLGHDIPVGDQHDLWMRVRNEDAANNVAWLEPSSVQRMLSIWLSPHLTSADTIRSVSDLAAYVNRVDPNARLCTLATYYGVVNGVRGMESVYGFEFATDLVAQVDSDEKLQAALPGCDCVAAYSNDTMFTSLGWGLLQDDRGFFQASSLTPVLNASAVQEFPELELHLTRLSHALTAQGLAELHDSASQEDARPERIAKKWLDDAGLLSTGQ